MSQTPDTAVPEPRHVPSARERAAVRRLATARLISLTGSGAAFAALAYIMFQLTGESRWVSWTLLLTFGAQGVFAPLGSALGDRFDRRKVLVIADLAAAAGFVALAFAQTPGQLLVMAFVTATLESPIWSVVGGRGAEPRRARGSDVGERHGRGRSQHREPRRSDPRRRARRRDRARLDARAAADRRLLGVRAERGLVRRLRVADRARPRGRSRASAARTIGSAACSDGVVFLLRDRVLRAITLAWVVLLLGAGFTLVAEVALAEELGAGSIGYGLLNAGWGGGAALGSFLAQRYLRERYEARALIWGVALVGLCLGLIGIAPWLPLAVGLMVGAGTGEGIGGVAEQGILQRRTPDHVRSRVIGA